MERLRINLGSGERPIPGFVNVDALEDSSGVDVVADIGERLPFKSGAADLIYASHVLEHFPTADVPSLLAEWKRVLRPGGQLLVAVPDLNAIATMLVERRRGWFTPPHEPWLGAIYGGQKDQYDFHKTGFTAPWLAHLMREAGFGEIRRVMRFEDIPAADASFSPLPFGINVSLNMRAVAGGTDELVGKTAMRPAERAIDVLDKVLMMLMRVSTALRSRLIRRRQAQIEAKLNADSDS